MVKIIGKGIFVLKDWANECEKNAGSLIVRTGYAGEEYTDRIVVACQKASSAFKGGTVLQLDTKMIDEIRAAQQGSKTLTFAKLRDITNRYA